MNQLKFTEEKLNVEDLTQLAASPKCGAISIFVGTTRDNFERKTVLKLEYEAYEGMAIKALEKICEEIRNKWQQVENIVIYHRLGVVPVKEASIVIAISSPHRADAMQATEWCINTVKEKVPIWKKEIYAESEPEWKENKESFYPPKTKIFKVNDPKIQVPTDPPHLVITRASNTDMARRLENCIKMKRKEIDGINIREFCTAQRDPELSCARVDSIFQKRKDSKGHLQVDRVLNTFHRDQMSADYLLKYTPPNGVEERFKNLELQLCLTTSVPKDIYKRLKRLEDRMMFLESISPEYVNIWGKSHLSTKLVKKKIFTIPEIDTLIADLEKKLKDEKKS